MEENSQYFQHLKAAKSCLKHEQYGKAMAHFVFLANVEPSLKDVFEEDFIIALRHWTELLESHQELDKLIVCLQESLKLYPGSVIILNNIGATLLRMGFTDEAACCFRRALQVDPSSIRARENIENIANVLVERWHFRMLNDKKRNAAYKEAISKAVAKGYDVVLDIGSGTGILSMFAVQSGAREVYACEMSKTMYEMAQDVLKANDMENSVSMMHKKSTDLKVGEDIPTRVSLVVTETLDCGLLGEGILSTIEHAWTNLLFPPTPISTNNVKQVSRVIPAGAKLYAMVVMCGDIRNQTKSKPTMCGIRMFPERIVGGEVMPQKAGNPSVASNVDQLEPYSTECLNSLRGGFTPLSLPFKVTEYDFNDPASLHKDMMLRFDVSATQTGRVDAIAVWFDLHLDEEITLSTGPKDDSLCWEQAVFPVFSPHPNGDKASNSSEVMVGDLISITGQLTQECLRVQFLGVKTSESVSEPCNYGELQQERENKPAAFGPLTEEVTVVPPSYMRRLNDEVVNNAYNMAISKAIKTIKYSTPLNSRGEDDNSRRSDSSNKCKVLDITYGPALSTFFAAREEVDCVLMSNPHNVAWIEQILNGNALPSVIDYGPKKLEEIVKDGRTWSCLVSDVVEPSGVIRQQVVEDIVFARGCLLKQESVQIIPMGFTLHCMCIESPFLFANCHILSQDNTLGLTIGQFMNEFQVATHVDVDLSTLRFTAVSDQVELFSLEFMQNFEDDNQVLSLLETSSEQRVRVVKSGTIHAVPYWFTLHFDSAHSLSTYSGAYPDSHWRQAVIILKEELFVEAGQEVLISASCINSSISIKVKVIRE